MEEVYFVGRYVLAAQMYSKVSCFNISGVQTVLGTTYVDICLSVSNDLLATCK